MQESITNLGGLLDCCEILDHMTEISERGFRFVESLKNDGGAIVYLDIPSNYSDTGIYSLYGIERKEANIYFSLYSQLIDRFCNPE